MNMVLGQVKTEAKSNEITSIPKLLSMDNRTDPLSDINSDPLFEL